MASALGQENMASAIDAQARQGWQAMFLPSVPALGLAATPVLLVGAKPFLMYFKVGASTKAAVYYSVFGYKTNKKGE